MNPTCVRWSVGARPSSFMRAMSNPGAANPVHDTVTRCVISSGSVPAADRAPAHVPGRDPGPAVDGRHERLLLLRLAAKGLGHLLRLVPVEPGARDGGTQ